MDRSTRGYRRVGVLVLTALAWFIPGAAGATDKLQVLVNDTSAQFQLAYRQHPDERDHRKEQLTAAIEAWRAAPRSEANNERLANWLRAAILSSMPGSQEPLPAVPSFATKASVQPPLALRKSPAEPQAVEKSIVKKAPVETLAKPENDPFRDDPVTGGERE
jgi:hypothetical protein